MPIPVPSWLKQVLEHAEHFTPAGIHGLLDHWRLTNRLGELLSNTPAKAVDLETFLVLQEAAAVSPAASATSASTTLSTPAEIRVAQARRPFDLGFGGEDVEFETYLEGIPEIPKSLIADDPNLPYLFLADPRLGLVESCRLIGIKYAELGYTDESAGPYDDRHRDPVEPFWFRCSDGRPNRKRKPIDCRTECTGVLLAGTAMVGIMAYAHKSDIVKEGERVIDLPSSVYRVVRGYCACLKVWHGEPLLRLDRNAKVAVPHCGSLVFRRE